MSFILDALKKSESDRQRQSGPALFEVKIAPPRSRFAVWGAAVGALLAINFVVVGFVLWRGSASHTPVSASAATAAAPRTNGAPPRAPAAVSPAPAPAPPAAAALAAAGTAAPPPGTASTGTASPGTASPGTASPGTAAPGAPPPSSPAPAAGPAEPGANPDDVAAAVEPHGAAAQAVTGVMRATANGLPTYQDAEAEPGANIPSLSLDLHVYSPQPDQRFVFLNMLKLREGDTTPQGVRVEHITEDGVVLSYRGKEFVLQRH